MIPPDAQRAMSKRCQFDRHRGQGQSRRLRIAAAGRCRPHRKGGEQRGSRYAVTNREQLERLRRVTPGRAQQLGVARRVAQPTSGIEFFSSSRSSEQRARS